MNPNHAENAQDWLDDADTFAREGAFVTVESEMGYTDFQLTPSPVQAGVAALAAEARAQGVTP